jgi:cation diffusion facilitator family transporter
MGYHKTSGAAIGDTPRTRKIRQTLWIILALNLGVSFAKMAWGFISGSVAMQADGFHSLFDGASNVVGLIGIYLAARPADADHPYGHGKYESYASAVIGAMLALVAYNVGSNAIRELMALSAEPEVSFMSFAIMLGTLIVNIGVTMYERAVGRKLCSEILIADSSHTASDVFVSLGVILGLVAIKLGFPTADPIVAIAVSGAIVWAAWGVFKKANETLSDRARIPPSLVCAVAQSIPEVLGCHHIRTRGSEAEIYVDLHIQVDPSMKVEEGHAVAERVERAICEQLGAVVDVIAHLEPYDEYQADKTAREIDAGLV